MTDATYERLVQELCTDVTSDTALMLPRLRRIFTLLAQTHFGDASNYGEYREMLEGLIYDPDAARVGRESPLLVMPVHVFSPVVQEAPAQAAVYVEVARAESRKLAFGDLEDVSEDTATVTLSRKKVTSINVYCEAASTDVAAVLAETAMDFFLGAQESISKWLGLRSMEVMDVAPYRMSGPSPQRSIWVLRMAISYAHRVFSNVESHRLTSISQSLTVTEA